MMDENLANILLSVTSSVDRFHWAAWDRSCCPNQFVKLHSVSHTHSVSIYCSSSPWFRSAQDNPLCDLHGVSGQGDGPMVAWLSGIGCFLNKHNKGCLPQGWGFVQIEAHVGYV